MKVYIRSKITAEHNYDIRLPNGKVTHLVPGSQISNIIAFAGKGCQKPIGDISRITSTYGGSSNEWQKVSGIGYIDYDGTTAKAELHWYQRNKYRYEMKVKRFL